MSHTRSPWAVDPNDPCLITADADGYVIAQTDYQDRMEDEQVNNAHLIAASPELLDVCERIASRIRAYREGVELAPSFNELMQMLVQLEAVTAKAKGTCK